MLLQKLQALLGNFYDPFLAGFKILGIIILAMLVVKAGSFIIKKLFQKQKGFKYSIDPKRLDTMASLSVSVFKYLVYILAAISILSDVFKMTSVLAAAGIGGVAIGLGAQSLIKDVISGFFIIMEGQFVVGDVITIDTMTGTVEEMELRITKLRNVNGDLHIIPNGEIKKVTNHTKGNKAVIVDVPVAYSSDIKKVMDISQNVCSRVSKEFKTLVEEPTVVGITELGREHLNLRITAKAIANEQWEIERKIRLYIKEEFQRQGISFSEARVQLHNHLEGKKNG